MNVVFLALPSACRGVLRSLSVAVRCSSLPLAERRALVEGSVSVQELGEAYPDCAGEMGIIAAMAWQSSFGADLGGLEFLDDEQWARLQARIPLLPTGLRYARWKFASDYRLSVLAETNMVALLPHVGERSDAYPLLESIGLAPLSE